MDNRNEGKRILGVTFETLSVARQWVEVWPGPQSDGKVIL